MGIFDSTTRNEAFLELPDYMSGLPSMLTRELESLIGQDYLTPDQLVAGLNPAQMRGIESLIASGTGTGDAGSAIMETGMMGLPMFGMGQDIMQQAIAGGPALNMGVDMDRVGAMVNDPLVDAQVTAALRDPYRNLTENQLPAASLSAAASGNVGSSRAAIGEAILQRGFEDRAADVDATIRGNAFNNALSIEASRAAQNPGLMAGFQGLQANVGQNLTQTGVQAGNLLTMGNMLGQQGIDQILRGGGMMQGQEQRMLDAGREGFMFPYQMLPSLMSMGTNLGTTFGTQVSEQTSDPGIGNTLLGAGLSLGGAALMGGMPLGGMFGGMMGGGGGFDPSGMVPYRGGVPNWMPTFG